MIRTVVFFMVLLAGCSAIEQSDTQIEPPELLESAPLPPINTVGPGGGMKINVMILVTKEGTVGRVRLLESSGEQDWDSLALQSIMKWQFKAARREGRPVDLWIRQPILVRLREPIMRFLAEIASATEHEADSLYSLITLGADFDSLLRHAVQASGGQRGSGGAVDVSLYSPKLRDELLRLGEGEVSRPLRFGDRFIIYKRLKKEPA